MDLVYLAIMNTCKLKYDANESYIFIENMDDEALYVRGSHIYPGQVFVLPESLAYVYSNSLCDSKTAVVAFIVKGEEMPW